MWRSLLCLVLHKHEMVDLQPTGWRTVWGDDELSTKWRCLTCGRVWVDR